MAATPDAEPVARHHDWPALVCPSCRQSLTPGLACGGCDRRFPVVAGIPDLRLQGDQYLDLEADRAKALELAALDDLDVAGLIDAYWQRTPEVPVSLARRYAANALDGVRRASVMLDQLGLELPGRLALDAGCGNGALVQAVAKRGGRVVGVDIALRWLVIAQRRLRDAGLDAMLVAADAAVLPFRAGSFGLTTCIEVIEHAADQRGLLHSCISSVGRDGHCLVVTTNRFSLGPERAFGLWGLGYLPRRWMPSYVRWRRATRADSFRPLSASEIGAFLGPTPLARFGPGPVPARSSTEPWWLRRAERAYETVRRVPLAAGPLTWVGPYIEVVRP
ncbi:MAG: methyltransferase domain-containing protein [Anaerolineales bacterium]